MVYGVVLAGGIGSRMGNVDKPKQFLEIGKRPIIVHTVEKFLVNSRIDKVIVLCPEQWISYTRDLFKKYGVPMDSLSIIQGGKTRNDTIMNAIAFIEETDGLQEDTIVVTHDSVRPFVSHRIIEDNIKMASEYGACDTVIPATDTIVESVDGDTISSIPLRNHYYQGQTPQSFKINKLDSLYNNLSKEEIDSLTDAAKIFTLNNEDVFLVEGDVTNIKITYPYDLKLANTILKGGY